MAPHTHPPPTPTPHTQPTTATEPQAHTTLPRSAHLPPCLQVYLGIKVTDSVHFANQLSHMLSYALGERVPAESVSAWLRRWAPV